MSTDALMDREVSRKRRTGLLLAGLAVGFFVAILIKTWLVGR